jgi:hypothetical protein
MTVGHDKKQSVSTAVARSWLELFCDDKMIASICYRLRQRNRSE